MVGRGIPLPELHCLYCERPLALLHRLTGDKEFCSKDHRRLYMKEHGELALSRLLQSRPQAEAKKSIAPGSIFGLNSPAPPVAEKAAPVTGGVQPAAVAPTPSKVAPKANPLTRAVRILTTPPPADRREAKETVDSGRKVEPAAADFSPNLAPPARAVVAAIRHDFGPKGEPRWPDLPVSKSGEPVAAPAAPLFVPSGAFLRRKLQPSAPASYWMSREGADEGVALPAGVPSAVLIEDRLRRTDRIGLSST